MKWWNENNIINQQLIRVVKNINNDKFRKKIEGRKIMIEIKMLVKHMSNIKM